MSVVDKIELKKTWILKGLLSDAGGFAKVYHAVSDKNEYAVAKLIPKDPGAARELLFESISGKPNILPVLDSGEIADYYVIVMPRAEKSLRDHLTESLSIGEVIPILEDIAEGLSSLSAGVIHRDLKPENILLYQGHWCLADFGISRYAEASTATDTSKYSKTSAYAAPEQWRGERATNATDIYAFGIIAFELLEGCLPYSGPDFREQHLNQPPPELTHGAPGLKSLIVECLFKVAAARPTAANILARLRAPLPELSSRLTRLQTANHSIVVNQAAQNARASERKGREDNRQNLFQTSEQVLKRIQERMLSLAIENAPAIAASMAKGMELRLGNGALLVDPISLASENCLASEDFESPFDVIAYTSIGVSKPRDKYGYEGRSHSLWYCDAHDEKIFRWYEIGFMIAAGRHKSASLEPFALEPMDDAAKVLTPVYGVHQMAWRPTPIDQGNEEPFVERWLDWFVSAIEGSLGRPSSLPENSGGKFRVPKERKREPKIF